MKFKGTIFLIGISICSILYLCFFRLLWVILLILLIVVFFYFSTHRAYEKKKGNNFLKYIIGFVILTIIVKLFFFDIYGISSSSMENTLIPGDKIIVNKLIYGPELPRTPYEIPLINIIYAFNPSLNIDKLYWKYRRLSGISSNPRGNVVVFRHPIWGNRYNFFIKRCIAIPGDTLNIKDEGIFVNQKISLDTENIKKTYKLWINDFKKFYTVIDEMGLSLAKAKMLSSDSNDINLDLTSNQKDNLLKSKCIDSIKNSINIISSSPLNTPSHNKFIYKMNESIVIPYKGMTIELDSSNFEKYNHTIKFLEQEEIKHVDGNFYIRENKVVNYTFKRDYFFMMGDYRSDSRDSRHWGFVPEENIVGIATLISFSKQTDFNWSRLFKRIH